MGKTDERCDSCDDLTVPRDWLDERLELAAQRGAKAALAELGLADDKAADDLRELRGLAASMKAIKDQALKTITNTILLALAGLLMLGAVTKLKLFGG
jgi:hypothetical protein